MAQISSGIGLVSGINYQTLIAQLVAIDAQPEQIVQSQITNLQAEQSAFSTLSTQLGGIQELGNKLALPQTFQAATATSSNTGVLSATAAEGAAVGSYNFQVAQLVTTQQDITGGFSSLSSLVGAGSLTIGVGGGQVSSQTLLSQLNGGQGVQRGQFRITDRGGNSAVVDTSDAVTIDDVVKDINSAANISVKATLTNSGIQLTDTSGQTKNDLTVADLQGGTAASSLGIAGNSGGTTGITGTAINTLGLSTQLGSLNDGRGIQINGSKPDFQVNLSDGTNFSVSLAGAQTVGDVLKDINTAGGSKIKATLAPDGRSLQLKDNSGGGGVFSVSALNSSTAAAGLGIQGNAGASTLTGSDVIAGLDSVLVSSLNGGKGISLGQISITDRAGDNSPSIDLSGASSLSDILNLINNNTDGVKVNASLNSAGTGIQITDTSGGSGNLVISDVNSTTAAALGIAGTFSTDTTGAVGGNLHRQYISNSTQLTKLGGGQGVNLGTISITNSAGASARINLATGSINTVGDVINAINNAHTGVAATLNTTGNGILLTDTADGPGKLKVSDVNGTAAADLNLSGTASGTTIDGAFQKTITVTSTDTLANVQNKINSLGFGVTAQLVNDGSSTNPYRLSLTSTNSGAAGQVIIDGGTTNLNPTTLVQGQDAAVFLGSGASAQPLLITSSTNQLSNVIKGVTINLVGASSQPVTLNISTDPSAISQDLSTFVFQFNTLTAQIGTFSAFNTNTFTGSLLLGNNTSNQITSSLYGIVNDVVNGAGQYKTLADVGITINNDGSLNFNSDKFNTAYAANPTAVQNLFSQAKTGLGNVIANAVTNLTDPVNGLITLQNNTLQSQIKGDTSYFNQLATVVAQQKQLLTSQFASLESNLATLQSQSQALGAFSSAQAAATASSSSSSSSKSSSSTGG